MTQEVCAGQRGGGEKQQCWCTAHVTAQSTLSLGSSHDHCRALLSLLLILATPGPGPDALQGDWAALWVFLSLHVRPKQAEVQRSH